MTRDQMILELNTALVLLDEVETRREQNLNNQLAGMQRIRKVRDAMREEKKNDSHDQQG